MLVCRIVSIFPLLSFGSLPPCIFDLIPSESRITDSNSQFIKPKFKEEIVKDCPITPVQSKGETQSQRDRRFTFYTYYQ